MKNKKKEKKKQLVVLYVFDYSCQILVLVYKLYE